MSHNLGQYIVSDCYLFSVLMVYMSLYLPAYCSTDIIYPVEGSGAFNICVIFKSCNGGGYMLRKIHCDSDLTSSTNLICTEGMVIIEMCL